MSTSAPYRALVYAALGSSLLAVMWGGVVRVTGSGLGCPDWPLCHGQFLPSLDLSTRTEWVHRLLASLSGTGIAGIAVWTLWRYSDRPLLLGLALLSAMVFILQALIGAITVLLELPQTWVTAHLANAELLLALLVTLAVLVRWPTLIGGLARPDAAAWLTLGAALGTFALILTGAYVRGEGATSACTSWPLCEGSSLGADTSQLVHMLHRITAAIVGVVVIAAALATWRRRGAHPALGPFAVTVGVLFIAQVAIGAANPLTGFSPWALGAHPAAASLLWCALVALVVVLWRPHAREATATLGDVVALTKPAIMSLLLLTALGAMFLAARGLPPFGLIAATMVGGALASGGASALNHYFDRDIDEVMRRTRRRPLPAHRLSARFAVALGIVLNVLAFAVLALGTNLLAALLAISGTVFYIGVYTLWLKRTTAQNIVIGGAAGAIPPLVGWAAVTGSLDLPAWLLFGIIFFWTPAHFWALALLIRDDYERAGVPMLPVVSGERAAAWGILWYAASLLPLSVLLFVIRSAGPIYLVAALVLGAVFLAYAVRLVRDGAHRRMLARQTYLFSLLYLALLFVAIIVDQTVQV